MFLSVPLIMGANIIGIRLKDDELASDLALFTTAAGPGLSVMGMLLLGLTLIIQWNVPVIEAALVSCHIAKIAPWRMAALASLAWAIPGAVQWIWITGLPVSWSFSQR